MSKVVITGGAGFIGSHLADRLLQDGYAVTIIDDLSTGKRENIQHILDRVTFLHKSICDADALRSAMAGAEYVFHEAALPSVPRSVEDPITTNKVNVEGTLLVLVAARDCKVKRVICASSSSVYGDSETLPRREADRPDPISPYAAAKLALENYCKAFFAVYGLQTVCLRYFNVFGPRQSLESGYAPAVPNFIRALLRGQRPVIFGDGKNSRDFTFVENVVTANVLAMHAPNVRDQAINIACGERTNLKELVTTLNRIIGTDLQPVFDEPRPGDVLHSQADISTAQQLLGYSPQVDLEEGLRRTVDWFRTRV